MKPFTLFILCLCLSFGVSAQDKAAIDSLQRLIANALHDTTRVQAYSEWAYQVSNNDPNKQEELLRLVQSICSKNLGTASVESPALTTKETLVFAKYLSRSLDNHGRLKKNQGDYDSTLVMENQALEIAEKYDLTFEKSRANRSLGELYYEKRDFETSNDYLNQALQGFESLGRKSDEGNVHLALGINAMDQGMYDQALEAYQKALESYLESGFDIGLPYVYHNRGVVYGRLGNIEESAYNYEKALEYYEKNSDRWGQANILANLGITYRRKSDFPKAIEYLNQSIAVYADLGSKSGMAYGKMKLAELMELSGSYAQTLVYFQEALALYIEIDDKNNQANVYSSMGETYGLLRDELKAFEHFTKALEIREEIGDVRGTADSYAKIGAFFMEQGELERGEEYLNMAINAFEGMGEKLMVASLKIDLGNGYKDNEKYEEAELLYKESLEEYEEQENKLGVGLNQFNIGLIYHIQDDQTTALDYFLRAYNLFRDINYAGIPLTTHYIGNSYLARKDYPNATRFLTESMAKAEETGWTEIINRNAESLARVYSNTGNYQLAFKYQLLHQELTDSLTNADNDKKLERLKAEFEFGQQRDSIQFANDRDRLVLENDITKRKGQQRATLIGLGLAVIIILIVIFFYRKLRRLNVEVVEQRDSLEDLNTTKDKFFSIIAHDLRSPMAGLHGLGQKIDYLIRKNELKELSEIGSWVDGAIDQLDHLLDNLLNWATSETGSIAYKPEHVSVEDLVNLNIKLYSSLTNSKELRLQTNLPDHYVWADRNMLFTILRNLLSNAIKFSPQGAVVTITSERKDDFVSIMIADEGEGMEKAVVDLILNNKSDQVDTRSGTSGEKGFGLGLKLCNEFTTTNHGYMEISSQVGKGSAFRINLPAEPKMGDETGHKAAADLKAVSDIDRT